MWPQALLKWLIRLLLVYLSLAAIMLVCGDLYGRSLMPLFRWELGWLTPEFRILGLDTVNLGGALRARLQVGPNGPLVVGGQVLFDDHAIWPIVITTPLAQSYQCPLILFSAAFSWPLSSLGSRVLLMLITLPFLLVLAMLDIPLVLLGSVWAGLLDTFAPGTNSLLAEWPAWMSDGGRLAMCTTSALLAVALSKRFNLV